MNRKLGAVTGALMLSLGACTPASYNLSNDNGLPRFCLKRQKVDANERRIVQEIKTIANLEHRYNTYNSSWGLVLEYCKQLLEGEKQ